MPKSKAAAERQRLANGARRFVSLIAALTPEWRWATRFLEDDRVSEIRELLIRAENLIYELAQDTASGRTVLNLPDEPRPLFDRPQTKPVVEPIEATVEPPRTVDTALDELGPLFVRPGLECIQCSKCNRLRMVAGERCFRCGNPEYGLVHIGSNEEVLPDWPSNPIRESKGKVKQRTKPKDDPGPPADWEDPTGEILAAMSVSGSAPVDEVVEAPAKHRYDVYLAADGEEERQWIGTIESSSLADTRTQAPETYGPDFMPGAVFEVEPTKGYLSTKTGMAYCEIAECATCGHRWPREEGVGCPVCVHGPAEIPAKKTRKPPRKTFAVFYHWDEDEQPINLGEIKAANFDEARARMPDVYRHESVRLPDGEVVKIDHDKLKLYQVSAKPRATKEVPVG